MDERESWLNARDGAVAVDTDAVEDAEDGADAEEAGGSGALDVYRIYLREVKRIPLLTPEQERELATRARAGDAEALRRLVEANLRWAVKVAFRYARGRKSLSLLDLIQEGSAGLMRAAETFDPGRGFRFSTYSDWWVRQFIMRAISNQDNLVRVPIHVGDAISASNRAPAGSVGAEGNGHGVKGKTTQAARRALRLPLSLDQKYGDEGDLRVSDVLADIRPLPDAFVTELPVDRESLYEAIRGLHPREAAVLRARFGLGLDGCDQEQSLQEVGARFGVTKERIRQIETGALNKLRRILARSYPEMRAVARKLDDGAARHNGNASHQKGGRSRSTAPWYPDDAALVDAAQRAIAVGGLGGRAELARRLGIRPDTVAVWGWRTPIPRRHRATLVQLAASVLPESASLKSLVAAAQLSDVLGRNGNGHCHTEARGFTPVEFQDERGQLAAPGCGR